MFTKLSFCQMMQQKETINCFSVVLLRIVIYVPMLVHICQSIHNEISLGSTVSKPYGRFNLQTLRNRNYNNKLFVLLVFFVQEIFIDLKKMNSKVKLPNITGSCFIPSPPTIFKLKIYRYMHGYFHMLQLTCKGVNHLKIGV